MIPGASGVIKTLPGGPKTIGIFTKVSLSQRGMFAVWILLHPKARLTRISEQKMPFPTSVP